MRNASEDWSGIRLPKGPKRKNLVIVIAGVDSSYHRWERNLSDAKRAWDLMVIQRGESASEDAAADIIIRHDGAKYAAISRLMQDIPWLCRYDRYWCCDDGIVTSWFDIQRIFALAEAFDLAQAHPALTTDSTAPHTISYVHPEYTLRYTSFVDAVAPVFNGKALQDGLKSIADKNTDTGAPLTWPERPGDSRRETAILDETPVQWTGGHDAPPSADEPAGLVYGYILKEPASGLPQDHAFISPEGKRLHHRLTPLLSKAILHPLAPEWLKTPVWRSESPWSGGPPQSYGIPLLSAECWCLSLGLNLRLDDGHPTDGAAETLLYIGETRTSALFAIDVMAAPASNQSQSYTLSCTISGQQNTLAERTIPGIPPGKDCLLSVQIYPQAGWICIRINGIPCQDVWCNPFRWHSAHSMHFGNGNLKGAIRNFWLSPTLIEDMPETAPQKRQHELL